MSSVTTYSCEEAAERVGVETSYLDRLVELGILTLDEPDRFSGGDVRRVLMCRSLEDAGIPLEAVGAAIQRGTLSLAFFDAAAYERFAALADETFRQVSERTGIPPELLTVVREAIGMAPPSPDDRLREDEVAIVPFIEMQLAEGFRPAAIERLLRVQGDSIRRITEQEAAWWQSEVLGPALAEGKRPEDVGHAELSDRISPLAEQTLLAMYHAQQARAWTANIIEAFEVMMDRVGIHSRLERLPAICFLDISGYTRLTQEHGDDAAADVAATVARLVRRNSLGARRQTHQMARRRRDVPLPRSRPGRARGARDGDRPRDRRTAAVPRGAACGPGPVPGGRLLRSDGEPQRADRRLRARERSPREFGGRRRLA